MPTLRVSTLNALKPGPKPYEIRDAHTKGLLIRVQPNGKRLWYFEWKRGRRVSLGQYPLVTLNLARAECPRVLARLAVGDSPRPLYHRPAPKRPENPTLDALTKPYREWFERDRKSQGYSPRSLEALNTALKALGDVRVRDLTEERLKSWVKSELTAGAKQRTVNRKLSAVRSLLNWAVDDKRIDANPLKAEELTAKRLGVASKKNPDAERVDVRALTSAEEKRLRDALPTDGYIRPLVLVALGTGLRRGELLRLKWSDVDFDHNAITVAISKSGKRRVVPFDSDVRAVLLSWRGRKYKATAPVFAGLDGAHGLVNIKRQWFAVRAAAKLPRARFHDLRHTHASRLLNAGTPMFMVARLLGHSEERTTEIYGHLDPEGARKHVEAARSNG